tara:strand:- start:736 stop:1581 length:846 start_codon:yes stop_codon:yes gene_type:complete
MKIFICTNKFQKIAAKVSAYSFIKLGFKDIEILELEKNEILQQNLNSYYLRNGKKTKFVDDLQSFTLLRFLPFSLNNIENSLIIDPDVFALQNPENIIDKFLLNNKFNIACTKINNEFRSEVMFIKNSNFKWSFKELINDLFTQKIDYKELINLKSKKYFSNFEELPSIFNHHDKIENDTIFLHTSKRITQPWKEGLRVDFYNENTTKYYKLKQFIKKTLNLKYDKSSLSNYYLKHPNTIVSNKLLNLFKETLDSGFIKSDELDLAIKSNYISEKFVNKQI